MRGLSPEGLVQKNDITQMATKFDHDVGRGSVGLNIIRGEDIRRTGSTLGHNKGSVMSHNTSLNLHGSQSSIKIGRSWQYGHGNVGQHITPQNDWTPDDRF
jgi:hypothetical protein